MIRRHDWPERLVAHIDARRYEPFEWGRNDCALFCANGIFLMTDVDLAQDLRGYSTEREALALIERAGGLEAFAVQAGLVEVHPGLAQRGDVVLVTLNERPTFGLVAGNGYWCAPGPEGLVLRPMDEVLKAYRV